jgi:hypothetical protein
VSTRIAVALVTFVLGASPGGRIAAAELTSATAQAYSTYLDTARTAFLARIRSDNPRPALKDGEIIAKPAKGDGITEVPGGLVHHWTAIALLGGTNLRKAVDVSQDYSRYPLVYRSVTEAHVLEHDDETYHVLMRVREHQAGITVVLQIRSTISYVRVSDTQTYVLSNADEISEVEDPGGEHERLLPPGHDRGYLWRASVLTSFRERPEGLVVEMETLGLSRRFPYMLGWFLEPIARRVGRKSVETSLQEFLQSVREPAPRQA